MLRIENCVQNSELLYCIMERKAKNTVAYIVFLSSELKNTNR